MGIRKPLVLLLSCLICLPGLAQRKVSADVEVKTVANGKVSTVTKSVHCRNDGRMVTVFKTPVTSYAITNTKGELKLYDPATNQVFSQIDQEMSSWNELVQLFLNGRIDDLGLGYFGYRATSTGRDGEYTKKTFTHTDSQRPKVEIVYENYLPIYCEYTSPEGKTVSKKYLSGYKTFGRFTMPLRITDISYGKGRDSTVTRTVYSSVRVDADDPAFDFEIPADATPMKIEQPGK